MKQDELELSRNYLFSIARKSINQTSFLFSLPICVGTTLSVLDIFVHLENDVAFRPGE